jgi:hypothetical protein
VSELGSKLVRATAQAISRWLSHRGGPVSSLGSGNVGFVVDKVELWHVLSEHFGFPCQSFHRLFHTHHHPSSGAGTIGQTVAEVTSGLSLTPSQETSQLVNTYY